MRVQVYGATQVVGPVQLLPPHWAHCAAPPVGGAAVEVVAGADLVEVVRVAGRVVEVL